jgi:MerR family transcriptional regulator, light-induced transcriptional regulator
MGEGLSIGELVARTGVGEGTLRMWERRHGFPAPARLPSGHRRYREEDVDAVRRVVSERAAGLSLASAIERAREALADGEPSLFAGLRRRRPDLQPVRLRKPVLVALTHAIEDESCARAERPLLFGSFQHERFYRQAERRWREFARTAELAVVFAEFERPRRRAGGPLELQIERSGPLAREWAVVCAAPGHGVCLTGIELPQRRRRTESAREFEVIWSVEPAVVRQAVAICLGLARSAAPDAVRGIAEPPSGGPEDAQLRLATAIAARTLERLS